MKIKTDENGYVKSYAFIGDFIDSIEVAEPENTEYFESNFDAYCVRDGTLVFDETKSNIVQKEKAENEYRQKREKECFSVINRGLLWYETLTIKQKAELGIWYKAWLDGTETLTVPKKPTWLN